MEYGPLHSSLSHVKQEHIFKWNFRSPKGVGASFFQITPPLFFMFFPCDDHRVSQKKMRETNPPDAFCWVMPQSAVLP
jgi:hypothetical protein